MPMAKKRQKVGQMRRTHSYKTKKRLEIKRAMLAQKAGKRHGKH